MQIVDFTVKCMSDGVGYSDFIPLPKGTTRCVGAFTHPKRFLTAPEGNGPDITAANPVGMVAQVCEAPPVGQCVVRVTGAAANAEVPCTAIFQ